MKKHTAIIGLGKFGFFLGRALVETGHQVLGVDTNEDMVARAQQVLTQVYRADAEDMVALRQMAVHEMDVVVVSVGHSLEASVLISLHLKELGAPYVVVKAISDDHEKILQKIGVDEIIFPERVAAEQLARKIHHPGFIDFLPMEGNIVVQEMTVDRWSGKSLKDLDLTNRLGIQIVAVRHKESPQYNFVPAAATLLQRGDRLVVLGNQERIVQAEP